MGYWTIYVRDLGKLAAAGVRTHGVGVGGFYSLVNAPPQMDDLDACGLGVAYFGEDKPDMSSLVWCSRRLSYVSRRSSEAGAEEALAAMMRLVAHKVEEQEKLAGESEALRARLMELEVRSARPHWWARVRARLNGWHRSLLAVLCRGKGNYPWG